MLICDNILLSYSVTNSYAILLIAYLFLFQFLLYKYTIIIPLIISILIGIYSSFFLNENFSLLNKILFFSISGFIFGEEIVEIIFIFVKILNNIEMWTIIIIFSIIFNLLIFLSLNKSYIICTSILFPYFVSNIYLIGISKKLPIGTIINSLVEEGFDMEIMKEFLSKKYNVYFLIFFVALLFNLLLRIFIFKAKNERGGTIIDVPLNLENQRLVKDN